MWYNDNVNDYKSQTEYKLFSRNIMLPELDKLKKEHNETSVFCL